MGSTSILSVVMGISVIGAVLVGGGLLFYVGSSPSLTTDHYVASGVGVVLLAQALVSLYLLTQSSSGI